MPREGFRTFTVIYGMDDSVREEAQLSAAEAVHCVTLEERSRADAIKTVLSNAASLYHLDIDEDEDGENAYEGVWIVAVFEGEPLKKDPGKAHAVFYDDEDKWRGVAVNGETTRLLYDTEQEAIAAAMDLEDRA